MAQLLRKIVASSVLAAMTLGYTVNTSIPGTLVAQAQTTTTEDKSVNEVNESEHLSTEQIVVKITGDGFVTSHGDHYHFYNGDVPTDAIFVETLLTDSSYTLNESDIVSDVAEGKIVKIGEDYRVFIEKKDKAQSIRTVDELILQSYGVLPHDAKNISLLKEVYQLDKAQSVTYEVDTTLDDAFIKKYDTNQMPVIVYLTEKENVILLNGELHVFATEPEVEVKISETVLTPKDYKLSEQDVVGELLSYKVVAIDDQHYLYRENDQTVDTLSIEEIIKLNATTTSKATSSNKTTNTLSKVISQTESKVLATDDGYVFNPHDVIREVAGGYIVPHGDHFHFILKSNLSAQSIAIANETLHSSNNTPNDRVLLQTEHVTVTPEQQIKEEHVKRDALAKSKKGSDGKPYTTSDHYTFSVESVFKVEKDGVLATHQGHIHFIPFSDLEEFELEALNRHLQPIDSHDEIASDEIANDDEHYIENLDVTSLNIVVDEWDLPVHVLTKKAASVYQMLYDELDGRLSRVVEQYHVAKDRFIFLPNKRIKFIDNANNTVVLNVLDDAYTPNQVEDTTQAVRDFTKIVPALKIPIDELAYRLMYTETLTDDGRYFAVPHVDHYHWVDLYWLSDDEIATTLYLLAHPELKPPASEGWGATIGVSDDTGEALSSNDTTGDNNVDPNDPLSAYSEDNRDYLIDTAAMYDMTELAMANVVHQIESQYHVTLDDMLFVEDRTVFVNGEFDSVQISIDTLLPIHAEEVSDLAASDTTEMSENEPDQEN